MQSNAAAINSLQKFAAERARLARAPIRDASQQAACGRAALSRIRSLCAVPRSRTRLVDAVAEGLPEAVSRVVAAAAAAGGCGSGTAAAAGGGGGGGGQPGCRGRQAAGAGCCHTAGEHCSLGLWRGRRWSGHKVHMRVGRGPRACWSTPMGLQAGDQCLIAAIEAAQAATARICRPCCDSCQDETGGAIAAPLAPGGSWGSIRATASHVRRGEEAGGEQGRRGGACGGHPARVRRD